MSIFEDVVEWVSDAVDTVTEPLDFVTKVPGFEEASDLIKDFARTPSGMVVFRALSTSLYGPLAWTIGPQVASVAFALPGLARGEDFWSAYTTEVIWRVEKTAEYFGGGEAGKAAAKRMLANVAPATRDLVARLGRDAASVLARPFSDLAADYAGSVSDLALYFALKAAYEAKGLAREFAARFGRVDFDPETGALISTTGTERRNFIGAEYFASERGSTTAGAARIIDQIVARQEITRATGAAAETKRKNDLLLAAVIVAAVGALAYWKRKELKP